METQLSKVLVIGAGGVGSVAVHKMAMNSDIFSHITLASRRIVSCEKVAESVLARTGVTIDCARIEPSPSEKQGASDDHWWLHLYVMLSRATCLEDLLLLRPPPRELLERGPPPHIRKALASFEARIADRIEAAAALAAEMGVVLPE